MPNEDHDRISEKMRDLIRILLVPNPKERPNVSQILQIIMNWKSIPCINLTASAK